MENFLNQVSQSAAYSENGTDLETIKKWPSMEGQSELISDTYSSAKAGDVNRRFNMPATMGLKAKRKGKVARHMNLADNDNNIGMQGAKNFDVFTNEES